MRFTRIIKLKHTIKLVFLHQQLRIKQKSQEKYTVYRYFYFLITKIQEQQYVVK
jgi:hypothetical protein